jgi:hypothetical protein
MAWMHAASAWEPCSLRATGEDACDVRVRGLPLTPPAPSFSVLREREENVLLQVREGQMVIVVFRNASSALVTRDDGSTVTSADVASTLAGEHAVVPLSDLRMLVPPSSATEAAGLATPVRDVGLSGAVDRVSRAWRSNLRKALAKGDRDAYNKVHDQLGQLAEWRRQKAAVDSAMAAGGAVSSSSRLAASVDGAIARLVEASSQVRAGLVVPRTQADEPATEHNLGVMQLLQVHMETEARLAGGVRVPATASESLVAAVARGTHGGPTVPNERAADVSGLWASAGSAGASASASPVGEDDASLEGMYLPAAWRSGSGEDMGGGIGGGAGAAEPLPGGSGPGRPGSTAFAFCSSRGPAHGLVQLLAEVDVARALGIKAGPTGGPAGASSSGTSSSALEGSGAGSAGAGGTSGLGQPCELYLGLWDASTGGWLGEEAVVQADARGRPVLPREARGPPRSPGVPGVVPQSDATSTVWSQVMFSNVPRASVSAGRLYVVLRLFRRGQLRDAPPSAAGGAPVEEKKAKAGGKGKLLDSSVDPGLASSMSSMFGLLGRGREADAIYRRPVGVAVVPVPPALLRLADGTPHRPTEAVVLMRPAKNDESRYFGLHRVLVSEREKDAEQDGRRRGLVVGGEGAEAQAAAAAAGSSGGAASSSASHGPGVLPVLSSVPLARSAGVGPVPIVLRVFGGLPLPVLLDPRYAPLFAPLTRAGIALAQPTAYQWATAGRRGAPPALSSTASRRGRMAKMAGQGEATPAFEAAPAVPPPVDVTSLSLSGLHSLPPSSSMPPRGVHRDVLYITLKAGIFSQDKKMTQRNVQVRVHVVLDSGAVLPCLLRAAPAAFGPVSGGSPPPGPTPDISGGVSLLPEWRSAVYYHTNQPQFEETLGVHLPSRKQFERAHLRFSFWHASANEDKTHPFGFAFLPLSTGAGAALRDGVHLLRCYAPPPSEAETGGTPFSAWYLVAPVCDSLGMLVEPATLPPPGESGEVRGRPALSVAHAAAARSRHMPPSAVPLTLAELYPSGEIEPQRVGVPQPQLLAGLAAPLPGAAAAGVSEWMPSSSSLIGPGRQGYERLYDRISGGKGKGAAAAPAAALPPWEAVPLEIRSRDAFEVETRLVSDFKARYPEMRDLSLWRATPPAVLLSSLGAIQRMTVADAVCAVRHMPRLTSDALAVLSGILGEEDGALKGADAGLRSGLLSAAVRLLATLLFSVASVRPAAGTALSSRSNAPLPCGQGVLSGLRVAPMARLPADSYAATHAVSALLAAGLFLPRAGSALLAVLNASLESVLASAGGKVADRYSSNFIARLGNLTLTLTLESALCLFRSLRPLLAITRTLCEQELAAAGGSAGGDATGASLSALRLRVLSLLASLARLPSLPTPPTWLLPFSCAALRQLPYLLAGMAGILLPGEMGALLEGALRPATGPASASLSLSSLLAVRAAVTLQLVDECTAAGYPALASILPTLLVALNASGVQRALALRVVAALLARRDAAVQTLKGRPGLPDVQDGGERPGGAMRGAGWALSSLLAELTSAVAGLVKGRPAAGDSQVLGRGAGSALQLGPGGSGSLGFLHEQRAILRAARRARLSAPFITAEGSLVLAPAGGEEDEGGQGPAREVPPAHTAPLSPPSRTRAPSILPSALAFLRPRLASVFSGGTVVGKRDGGEGPWEWECRGLSEAEYEEVFGPPQRRGREEEGAASSGAIYAAHAVAVGAFLERSTRLAITSWMSLVWACPHELGPYLLATLSPLAHELARLPLEGGGPPVAAVHEHARLRLALQLLRGPLAFLASSPLASPWLGMGQLLHTACLRVHRWVAGLLASAYSAEDSPWALALPVWTTWVELTVAFLTSPLFAPEALAPARRQAVVERYGDRRGEVCDTLRTVWGGALGPAGAGGASGGAAGAVPPPRWAAGCLLAPPSAYTDVSGAGILRALEEAARRKGTGGGAPPAHSGLCAPLRLALAPSLVAPLLDLTHCVNATVSTLARDAYLDLLRAELTVQGAASRGPGEGTSPLPVMERLTIDTIDVLAAHKGPSLVFVGCSSTSGPAAPLAPSVSPSATRGPAPSLPGFPSGGMPSRVAALIRAASSSGDGLPTLGGPRSDAPKPPRRRGTLTTHSAYVPPPDNLLMQLFAPKRMLRRAKTGLPLTAGGAFTLSLGGGAFRASVSPLPGRPTLSLGAEAEGGGGLTSPSAAPPSALAGAEDLLTHKSVVTFLGEIRTLYSMLSSVSKYPHTPEWEDERASAALVLIAYLRTSHRRDMHSKYVTFLTDLHTALGNAAEAALAHLLHADVLVWGDETVPGKGGRLLPALRFGDRTIFPAQVPSARLEAVLTRAASELEAAGCWEEAVRIGELLAGRYEYVTAEYEKLSRVLRTNAGLYERMSSSPRIHVSYFVVSYSAAPSFPPSVRGRVFVYRGGLGERLGDFEERLLGKWPGAGKGPFRLRLGGVSGAGGELLLADGGTGNEDEEADEEEGEEEVDPLGEAELRSEPMELGFGGVLVVPTFPVAAPGGTGEGMPRTPARQGGGGRDSPPAPVSSPSGEVEAPPPHVLTHPSVVHPRSLGEAVHSPSMSMASVGARAGGSLMGSALLPVHAHRGPLSPGLASTSFFTPSLASPTPAPLDGLSRAGMSTSLGAGLHATPAPQATLHVPGLIRKGREQAGARFFLHQRPFSRRTTKSGSDYLDLWVARTYLATADAFPATHRRSPVIAAREVALNPIEVAVAGMRDRTAVLADLVERAEACADRGAEQAFSATLQGVVDAAVSGGLANYGPFLTGAFATTHPEIAEDLAQPGKRRVLAELREAIAEQVAVAGRGIRVHEVKCAAENVPLHEFLVRRFASLVSMLAPWGIE